MQVSADISKGNKKQLLMMLYDAVILNLNDAIHAIGANNVTLKLAKIDKALSIIERGLILSLSKDGAKEVAESLEIFYENATMSIVFANTNNDVTILNNVKTSFAELKQCWNNVTG